MAMGKSAINVFFFNSYVSLPEGTTSLVGICFSNKNVKSRWRPHQSRPVDLQSSFASRSAKRPSGGFWWRGSGTTEIWPWGSAKFQWIWNDLLVGGFNLDLLWKMMDFVSWDDEIPNIWKNKTCPKPPTNLSILMICMEGSRLWNPVLWCDGDVGIDVLNLPRVKPDNIELAPSGNSAFKLQWVTATQSISENHGMFIHHHPSSSIMHHHPSSPSRDTKFLWLFIPQNQHVLHISLEPSKGTQRVDPIRWVPSPNCEKKHVWEILVGRRDVIWTVKRCYDSLSHDVIIFIAWHTARI